MRTCQKYILAPIIVIATLGSLITGCAQEPAQAQVAESESERVASPDVAPADGDRLVAGNNAFAFDLYQALRDADGNLFFSPYSVSGALAMTYAGARGETERQMAETLHFGLPQDSLHPAFNALDHALVAPEQDAFELHIANSLWGQTGYSFLEQFLDVLAKNYGAGLRLLNFESEQEESRQEINDWISDQTEERIEDLIPPGGITPNTTLVLANAIYFDADWLNQFDSAKTRDGTFNPLDGDSITVPMMAMKEPTTLPYSQGDGYQAVELPYIGDKMSMLVLVPDAGQFETVEANLDAALFDKILTDLEPRQTVLRMPKFSYESDFSLAQTLAEMGMPAAFGSADFSGMDGTQNLTIGDVFHKAFIAVDEAGTEAAAATAVVMEARSLPIFDIELTIDRPFIYVIRDKETDSILFVGRVVDLTE
jgi:serpin B